MREPCILMLSPLALAVRFPVTHASPLIRMAGGYPHQVLMSRLWFKIICSGGKWDSFHKTWSIKHEMLTIIPLFKMSQNRNDTQHCHSAGSLLCYLIPSSQEQANIPGDLESTQLLLTGGNTLYTASFLDPLKNPGLFPIPSSHNTASAPGWETLLFSLGSQNRHFLSIYWSADCRS